MKERLYGVVEKGADVSKKADVLIGAVAVIAGSAPLVALAIVSFVAGDKIQKWAKEKQKSS